MDIGHIAHEWRETQPFPYSIIPGFLEDKRARLCAKEFRDLVNANLQAFVHYRKKHEHEKHTLIDLTLMPTPLRELIEELNSPEFISEIEKATGLSGLKADPKGWGSGLHCTTSGGYLSVHHDFPIHPLSYGEPKELQRVLNLIIFLNDHITPTNAAMVGGPLELWQPDMSRAQIKVPPIFNTAALFWVPKRCHGQPNPWMGSRAEPRLSVASYYYQECEPGLVKHRSTAYFLRPQDSETPEEFFERCERASAERYTNGSSSHPSKS